MGRRRLYQDRKEREVMRGMQIEDMPVTARIKGNPRIFDTDDLKDVREFRAIMRARPPIVIWRDSKELKEAK